MSAGRFKSKDDYFSKKSGLTERVIQANPQKPPKKETESNILVTLLRVHFCKTVDSFEIKGEGKFRKGEYSLDDALSRHLAGDANVLINPLSHSGETAFSLVKFDLSPEMDQPFNKARQFADELLKYGIPSQIEITGGGNGHYHLFIFHEEPIPGRPFSEALIRLGHKLFSFYLETTPQITGDSYVSLPLQREETPFHRTVFVDDFGKMIKDQIAVLRAIEPCKKNKAEAFIGEFSISSSNKPETVEFEKQSENNLDTYMHEEEKTSSSQREKPKPFRPVKAESKSKKILPETSVAPKEYIFLVFNRSDKEFGIAIKRVEKIIPAGGIELHPGIPSQYYGIKKLEKQIVFIADPGSPSGFSPVEYRKNLIILVRRGGEVFGILADSVCGATRIEGNSIRQDDTARFSSRIALLDNGSRKIILLDDEKIFSGKGKNKLQENHKTEEQNKENPYMVFSQGNSLFGLQAEAVIKIITEKMPDQISWVNETNCMITYNGKILPIFNLPQEIRGAVKDGKILSLYSRSMNEKFMIVQNNSSTFCVRADDIIGIRNITKSGIESLPGQSEMESGVIEGVVNLSNGEDLILILDPDLIGN
jgi:chemotaxis signal transduction protein